MWVMGHYVPVPSDTGWTDGDLEDKYLTSRYRVLINKDQYDRPDPSRPFQSSPSALFESRTDRRVRLALHNTRRKANEHQSSV
jgi:hypothetical protein